MISLQLHPDQITMLVRELRRAGRREIGGVLVGEHLGDGRFRVADLSVQRSGGTYGCFVRRPEDHSSFLDAFFRRTGNQFERFNYLGEWHSHPSFSAYPSSVDSSQMQAIVEDGPSAPLFAVLIVVRLPKDDQIELCGAAFRPKNPPTAVDMQIAERPTEESSLVANGRVWWRRLLKLSAAGPHVRLATIPSSNKELRMSLKSRFEQPGELVEALLAQKIVQGRRGIAEAIAEQGELMEFIAGQNIIEQGSSDRDIHFLIAGQGHVIINGVRLYPRDHGMTVGEMSAVNPHISRSSTIEASELTVTWRITHKRLADIGSFHPDLWRLIAVDLASRLEQRNRFVNRINARPRVFMMCSAEALMIAKAIRVGLEHYADVVIWSDEKIFPPGAYPIEALEEQVNQADFGIALAEPDDLLLSRDRKSATPRDNVIFELGFFMSRLGRHRTLLLVPRAEEVKLPSDFKGLTPIAYAKGPSSKDLPTALGPTIDKITSLITEKGVRASLLELK